MEQKILVFKKTVKSSKRVGRGSGSGMGKTSTRGSNGQKSRSGCALKNFQGGQKNITSLPIRGFNPVKKTVYSIVHIEDVIARINYGLIDISNAIDSDALYKAGLLKKSCLKVKLLSKFSNNDAINIKLLMKINTTSANVRAMIENAGGSFEV
jgi:large subunit ribosomal protein L15